MCSLYWKTEGWWWDLVSVLVYWCFCIISLYLCPIQQFIFWPQACLLNPYFIYLLYKSYKKYRNKRKKDRQTGESAMHVLSSVLILRWKRISDFLQLSSDYPPVPPKVATWQCCIWPCIGETTYPRSLWGIGLGPTSTCFRLMLFIIILMLFVCSSA